MLRFFMYCPRCYKVLRKVRLAWEKQAGYEYLCKKCDENYFSFEALTKDDIIKRREKSLALLRTCG